MSKLILAFLIGLILAFMGEFTSSFMRHLAYGFMLGVLLLRDENGKKEGKEKKKR